MPLRGALAVDLHCDALYQMVTHGYDIHRGARPPSGYTPEVSLDLMERGGLVAQVFAVWLPGEATRDPEAYTTKARAAFRKMTQAGTGFRAVRTVEDLYAARDAGLRGALLSIEGAEALGDKAENLRAWAEDGLVIVGLVWNRLNAFADASQAKKQPYGGLSPEGERLVDLAAALGILVDVSHASDDAFWDVMRRTTRPVIATHSSSRAVYHHPRNLDDEQVRAIAASGGVVGVNFHATFLASGGASIDEVVAHLKQLRAAGGAGVLALGADYDGGIKTPRGLEDVSRLPALRDALVAEGFSEEDLALLWGRNFARALAKARGPAPLVAGQILIPIKTQATASSALAKHPAALAVDRSGLSAWVPAPDDPAPTLSVRADGAPPRELALRGPQGAPVEVELRLRTSAQEHRARLTVPDDADGVGLVLPALAGEGWELQVSFPKGAKGLAEVVAYERP